MSITISNYTFEGPFTSTASLRAQSGVYVILCQLPDSLTVIDVGESGNVKDRVSNHDRQNCWSRNCSGTLQVAAYYCNEAERMQLESTLRQTYKPPCGQR